MESTYNLNNSDCIFTAQNFFSITVVNVCNNTEKVVPMGNLELLANIFGVALISIMLIAMVAGFVAVCYHMLKY
jgi:hypothetical protein